MSKLQQGQPFLIGMQINKQQEKFEKPETSQSRQTGRIKRTTEDDSSVSSDDEYFVQAVTNSFQAKRITGSPGRKQTVTVRLQDVGVQVEPDSGAEVNVMDEHQFQVLVTQGQS